MTLAWLTDIHLNFLRPDERAHFISELATADFDHLVITGDIGEAPTVATYLEQIYYSIRRPLSFVLGNHDYYLASVDETRTDIKALTDRSLPITYLGEGSVVSLSSTCALVGHDGWADGRFGDYVASPILLSDYLLIEDFQPSSRDGSRLSDAAKQERHRIMTDLANDCATALEVSLAEAAVDYQTIVVATHVPPFEEACWYKGKTPHPLMLPHLGCGATGDVIRAAALGHPNRRFIVLCGHTHWAGTVEIEPNLTVITGGARYRHPALQESLELD